MQAGDTSVMVTAVSRGRSGPVPNFLPLTVNRRCVSLCFFFALATQHLFYAVAHLLMLIFESTERPLSSLLHSLYQV